MGKERQTGPGPSSSILVTLVHAFPTLLPDATESEEEGQWFHHMQVAFTVNTVYSTVIELESLVFDTCYLPRSWQ